MAIDLSATSIFRATHAQTIESRKRTHVMWSRGLSMESYLRRDERMEVMEHASNDRLTTWVLVPRHDPETLDFLCSCETYRRQGVSSVQGEVQEVVAYAVASVFTPEGKRRQGYASHMMRLLHWVVSNADFRSSHRFPVAWGSAPTVPEGYGNGLFSVLYSDVGPDYYSQCGPIEEKNGGWVVDKPISTIIPLSSFSTDSPARWRPLDLAALEQTWQEDALVVGQEVGSSSYPVVAFLPTGGVAATQVIRTMDAVSGELPLRVWGTRLDDPSSLTFATWSLEIDASGPKSLIVTRLRVADLDHFADLVSQLMKAAGEAGVREVEIWNLAAEFVQMVDALGGKTEARTEHLPSIKFYLSQGREHRPEWLLNEKFAWC